MKNLQIQQQIIKSKWQIHTKPLSYMTVNIISKNDLDFDLLGNRVAMSSPLYRAAAARLMELMCMQL